MEAYREKGLLSLRRKWRLRYWLKITLIGDDTISLNEYKATIAGSDIDITDVVMQEKDIDELIENETAESDLPSRDELDFYDKDGKKSGRDERDTRKPRPTRSGGSSKSKYYKQSDS